VLTDPGRGLPPVIGVEKRRPARVDRSTEGGGPAGNRYQPPAGVEDGRWSPGITVVTDRVTSRVDPGTEACRRARHCAEVGAFVDLGRRTPARSLVGDGVTDVVAAQMEAIAIPPPETRPAAFGQYPPKGYRSPLIRWLPEHRHHRLRRSRQPRKGQESFMECARLCNVVPPYPRKQGIRRMRRPLITGIVVGSSTA
jgi:hypothetical protein